MVRAGDARHENWIWFSRVAEVSDVRYSQSFACCVAVATQPGPPAQFFACVWLWPALRGFRRWCAVPASCTVCTVYGSYVKLSWQLLYPYPL